MIPVSDMSQLFEKTRLQSIELRNRFIRSATWSGVGDERGYATDLALEFYGTLAEGSIGLIVSGYQYVLTNGNRLPYSLGNYHDGQTEGLTRLAAVVHAKGGKIVPQLVHAGSRANTRLFRDGDELWGPSAVPDPVSGRVPLEMIRKHMLELIEAYATAAARSKQAGFDGVQLHCGHGYGINQFLSPAWNRRTDTYGGNAKGRYRLLGEIVEAVRGAVGEGFPILVKLNGHDFVEGGLLPEDSVQIARRLADDGIAAIEVSGGSAASPENLGPVRKHIGESGNDAYFADLAQFFKEAVDVPIIAVGGIRSLGTARDILAHNKADYVAMCRPFIREPHILRRWQIGDFSDAKCISCNGCFETGMKGIGISCKTERMLKERREEEPKHNTADPEAALWDAPVEAKGPNKASEQARVRGARSLHIGNR